MSSNTLRVETLTVGQMAANCYIAHDGNEAVLIDPGDDGEYIIGKIQETGTHLIAIIATHGHSDHVNAAFEVQTALGVPFYMHRSDMFFLDRMKIPRTDPPPAVTKTLSDGDILPLGFRVIHTPGHTPGGITLYQPKSKIAFVGDLLFADGAVGRTDFSYSRPLDLSSSIKKIRALPEGTTLYPGHGDSFVL